MAALCLPATDVRACGELMLRSLGAMRYHAFVTRNPAAIVLYSGEAANNKRPAATDARLHDGLESVGHKVTMARGPGELGHALTANRYDVIIAYADDMVAASDQIAKASREAALIPVLDSAAHEREMRERFPHLVTGSFNDLLKTIEQVMIARKA
jgi:hypothetical protein